MKIHRKYTVRPNRLGKCSVMPDEVMKTQATHQEMVTMVGDAEIRITKWFDYKDVHLLCTYASTHLTKEVHRWDIKSKDIFHIKWPNIVFLCNASMGGVNLLDSLISLYIIKIRSRNWYHRMVFYFVDMVVVQCWLLYRRDSDMVSVSKK